MGLHNVQVSRVKKGCIAASGMCGFGDPTPVLPGEYPRQVLQRLARQGQSVLAEISAPLREKDYFLEPSLPQYPLQPRLVNRLSGRGILLGVLRGSTAPFWFEDTEIRRGYLVNAADIDALAHLLSRRSRMKDLLDLAPVRFEHHCTRSLLLWSSRLSLMALADASIQVAYEMNLPVRFDENEFKESSTGKRAFGFRPAPRRLSGDSLSQTFEEEPSCSISSLLR